MSSKRFDWLNSENVVFHRVDAVAVYMNEDGQIVIRQEDPMGDEDNVIVIGLRNVPDLLDALQNVIV